MSVSDLVAPMLKVGLLVETWPNGKGRMKSRCRDSFPVENVESLTFTPEKVNFTTHHDHSKWAISLDKSRPFVCIGDINRMDSQTHRAGGTVCIKHEYAWKAFGSIITDIESCPKTGNKP